MVIKKSIKMTLLLLKFYYFVNLDIIKKIGNWEIELIPENNLLEENNFPDWYGYRRIDNV